MARGIWVFAAAAALLSAAPASAQNYPCWNNRGLVDMNPRSPTRGRTVSVPDPQSSATWAQLGQSDDPNAHQALAGVWYAENRSAMGQTQYIYSTFEPNGLFSYRDSTCGATGLCSQNQGAGEYRAAFQSDGSIFYMVNFSDLARDHQCASQTVRAQDGQTLLTRQGGVMRRAQ